MTCKHLLFLLAIVAAMSASAADMEQLFLAEKGGIFPLLDNQSRLIMLDNYKSGGTVPVTNLMAGDSSKVAYLSADEITVITSPAKSVQARLLTSGRDSVIALVETFKTPYLDSRISFYSTQWKLLKSKKYINIEPSPEMFYLPSMSDNARSEMLMNSLPMISMAFEGNRLVLRHSFKQQLLPEVYARLEPLLRPEVVYSIEGTKLKCINLR